MRNCRQGDIFAFRPLLRHPRSEPDCKTRLVAKPDPTYIRSLFETAAPTSRLRRARAQEDKTILAYGHFRAIHIPGSSHLDPPGLIGSRKICRIQFG